MRLQLEENLRITPYFLRNFFVNSISWGVVSNKIANSSGSGAALWLRSQCTGMLSFQWTTPGFFGQNGHCIGRLVQGAELVHFSALLIEYLGASPPSNLQYILAWPFKSQIAQPLSCDRSLDFCALSPSQNPQGMTAFKENFTCTVWSSHPAVKNIYVAHIHSWKILFSRLFGHVLVRSTKFFYLN